ncbi:MAG: hypothetical protein QOK15_221 [Nocardioidaceae bacterium]|nr:hypothetical protein [Nocardioidaceae bacterium]
MLLSLALGGAVLAILFGVSAFGPTVKIVGLVLCLVAGLVLTRGSFARFVLACLVVRSALDILSAPGANARSGFISPSGALAIAFTIAALVWFTFQRLYPSSTPPARPSRLRAPALALVAAACVSVLSSLVPTASLVEAIRITAAVVMLLVLEGLLERGLPVGTLLVAVYASAVLPMVMALVQSATHTGVTIGGFRRATGTFDHPNPLAIYLTFLLVMGVALFPWVHRPWRLPLAAMLGCGGVVLLLTYTRSAWIAALLGVLVVGALQSRRLVVATFVGVLGVILLVPSVLSRFSDVGQAQYTGAAGDSLTWRFQYWGQLLHLAQSSPLTGIGLKVVQLETVDGKNAHDDFLRAYVEMGLIGLLAYVALMVALGLTALAALRSATTGLERGIAVGFAGTYVSFALLSTVSNILSQTVLLWYFFAFAALAAYVAAHGSPTTSAGAVDGLEETPGPKAEWTA